MAASTSRPRMAKPAPARGPRLAPNSVSKKSLKPPEPRPAPKRSPKSPYSTCPPSQPGGGVKSAPVFQFSPSRSEEHTSELQSLAYLVCRLLLEKKKKKIN